MKRDLPSGVPRKMTFGPGGFMAHCPWSKKGCTAFRPANDTSVCCGMWLPLGRNTLHVNEASCARSSHRVLCMHGDYELHDRGYGVEVMKRALSFGWAKSVAQARRRVTALKDAQRADREFGRTEWSDIQ